MGARAEELIARIEMALAIKNGIPNLNGLQLPQLVGHVRPDLASVGLQVTLPWLT